MKQVLMAALVMGAASAVYGFDASHPLWTAVLKKHNQAGLIDYKSLKNHPDELNQYLRELAMLSEQEYAVWGEADKIAFWINAYNAYTWKAIIDHYPIKSSFLKSALYPKNSIRQIDGVWDKLTFPVMGKHLTLEHIEHQILRKNFNEPRIHVALVCAALGCPPLRKEAFVGEKLEAQLGDQSRQFLAEPGKFRIDRENKVVYLSAIFDWFGDDFIKTYAPERGYEARSPKEKAVLNFIGRYLNSEDRAFLENDTYAVKYLKYDWTLNEQRQ